MNKSTTETMRFRCPHCSVILRSNVKDAGKKQRCPKCEKTFKIPQAKSKQATSSQAAEPPKESKKPQEQLIPVICTICSTRMYASESQIGGSIECPDCFTQNLVKPVSKSAKKAGPRMDASMNYDIEPEQQIVVTTERGQDLLDKADEELQKEIEEAPKFPAKPFVTGVYTYPFWMQVLPSMVGITLSWTFSIVVIRFALRLPFMIPVAAMVGLVVLLPTLVTFQKIVENTSIADDESDCRPEGAMFAFIDWAIESIPIAFALFLTVLPVAIPVTAMQLPPPLLLFAAIPVYLLFPLIYLSMLENNSAAGVYSKVVFGSLAKLPGTWFKFYSISGIVLGLVAASIFGFLYWRNQFDPAFPPTITQVGTALLAMSAASAVLLAIYFRLIGRVALVLSQKITVEETERESGTKRELESDVETADSVTMGV